MSHKDSNQGSNFFSGLLLGAIAGAGLIWFLTKTKDGVKIGQQVKEKTEDGLIKLGDLIEDIEEKGQEFKQKVEGVKKEIEQKAEGIKGVLTGEQKENLDKINKLQQRGLKTKKFFTKNGKSLAKKAS